jgi:hypothetical protein
VTKLSRQILLRRAETVTRESRFVDFKREFDLSSAEAWCEVIKDVVAFANSGGGVIVFGVANDGTNAKMDPVALLAYDTADITNRIAKYTNYQFSDIEVVEIKRGKNVHAAFIISAVDIPMIFAKPGTYDIGGNKQKTAFSQGTIYFRHGSKSEPGNRDDLAIWRDREVARVRKSWLGGIRQVVETSADDAVAVISSSTSAPQTGAVVHARLSSDPSAVPLIPGNTEELWPHRQVDLIREVNKRLAPHAQINTHDIQCIKKAFDVFKAHPDFAHKPHHLSSPQYSEAFVDWIVEQYGKDNSFFRNLRAEWKP